MVQNHLAVVIFAHDPETLNEPVHLLVPLEVGSEREIYRGAPIA